MSSPLRPGDRLAGYRIERELGHGATGVVYLARQEALDRPVALKVAGAPLATDAAFRERFRREAQAAAGLEHPNVVTVLDSGADDEHLWLAMRLVDGPDLRVLLRRTGRLEPEQAVSVVEQVAAALDAAHAAGLVHRDVKPGNVLVEDGPGRELHVELADFGLVRPSGAAAPGDPEGTPGYAAPEQLAGEDASAAVDVFGLGCVLYELLTGIPPTPVAARAATGDQLPPRESYVHREGLRPSDALPALGVAFDRIVLAATDPDPGARPASAGEVAVAARAALTAPQADPPASAAAVRAAAAVPATADEMAIPPDRLDEHDDYYDDHDEFEPDEAAAVTTLVAPPRSHRRSWLALGLFATVVLAVLAAAFLFIGPLGPAEQARVTTKGATAAGGGPDLTGRSPTGGRAGANGSGGTRPGATAGGATSGGGANRDRQTARGGGSAAGGGAGPEPSADGATAETGAGAAGGSAGADSAGGSTTAGGGARATGADSDVSSAATGASGRSRSSIPVVADGAPGAGPARTRPAPAAGDERFGGGGWSLDLPAAENWRQTAVQERDGGRRIVTRLLRPDGARLILEYLPGSTAVFGYGPSLPFRVRPVGGGRVDGSLFRGGRYAPCRRGVCAAVPVNGADGGLLLVAAAAEPDAAQRLAIRAVRGLRVR